MQLKATDQWRVFQFPSHPHRLRTHKLTYTHTTHRYPAPTLQVSVKREG